MEKNKRDYAQEIDEIRNRLGASYPGSTYPGSSHRWEQVVRRIDRLYKILALLNLLEPHSDLLDALNDDQNLSVKLRKLAYDSSDIALEIKRYIPIGLVACIEGFFHLAYADLINHGPPFRENAANFDIRFSIRTAVSLEHHLVSLGEFVAHLLPISNLAGINRHMSGIIGQSFLDRFREMRPKRAKVNPLGIEEKKVTENILADVERTFKARHMYCHEVDPVIGSEIEYSVHSGMGSVNIFIWISEQIVSELLENKGQK